LIVGDIMLDRYWRGGASRISPEAPVPVVHVHHSEERPGGAGNVALNIRALGASATLLGVSGDDEAGDILADKLIAAGVTTYIHRIPNIPTVTKLRVISRNQQLIRLDFEEPAVEYDCSPLLKEFQARLSEADIVILSDYSKGAIGDPQQFIQLAKAAGVRVLVDPKGNDFARYRGAYLLKPNRKEFETVVGCCKNESEIISKGKEAILENNISALLVTRGEQGMTLLRSDHSEFHLPAKNREVFDVTGAGDTVISVLASVLAVDESLEHATTLANIAASITVTKLGAATVSVPELRRTLFKMQGVDTGVLSEDQLIIAVADARHHGERIVLTNRCFDILHAGHVTYLEEAKKLGDRLIVAVNDDESVKRLKGKARPINTLSRRMAVLAALGSVDWVVPFSEDTPERLINRVLPDILVKGGDYKVEQISGSQAVLNNGGDVKILPFVPGCSTTAVVDKLLSEEISE
jgi:D-beta-D-heptose 7-phosphate kinase/D-beta-D-heptose 1-phosphate adenosyltransferase